MPKRWMGIVFAVLMLVSWGAMRTTAQDDAVPVLQTQVADLETRVAALEGNAVTPAAGVTVVASSGKAMLFQGTGHQIIDVGRLEGVYLMQVQYPGSGAANEWIGVELTGRQTGNWESPFTIGSAPFDETFVINIYDYLADDYLMEVTAQGDWSITIEPAS